MFPCRNEVYWAVVDAAGLSGSAEAGYSISVSDVRNMTPAGLLLVLQEGRLIDGCLVTSLWTLSIQVVLYSFNFRPFWTLKKKTHGDSDRTAAGV